MPIKLHIHPKETALIVVDVQVDFCSPDGATARRGRPNSRMQALPAKVNEFVRQVHPLGMTIIYTQAIVDDDAVLPENVRLFNQYHNISRPTKKGSGGEELYGLDMPDDSIVIQKSGSDAFDRTILRQILVGKGITTVLICGVRTEICVDATTRRASQEGFHTFLIENLCATRDNTYDDHHYAVKFLRNYHSFVMDSDEILKIMLENDDTEELLL